MTFDEANVLKLVLPLRFDNERGLRLARSNWMALERWASQYGFRYVKLRSPLQSKLTPYVPPGNHCLPPTSPFPASPTHITYPSTTSNLISLLMIMNNSLNIMPTWTNDKCPIVPWMISLPYTGCPIVFSPSLECSLMKRLDLSNIYIRSLDPMVPPEYQLHMPCYGLSIPNPNKKKIFK